MPWYLMPRQKQLAYAHVLNRIQNGTVLKIGPFALLNFETFSDVTAFPRYENGLTLNQFEFFR